MAQDPSVEGPEPAAPPARLWRLSSFLVTQVAGRAHSVVLDALGPGRTKNEYAVLATLEEYGPMSQATLGRRLLIDRSDIVALLDKLCAERLALRSRDKVDRRRNVTSLTPKGRKVLTQLDRAAAEAQEILLSPLSSIERRQLSDMLTRLVAYHSGQRPPGTEPAPESLRPVVR